MIDETISRIEGRIRSSELSVECRAELIELLSSLRGEIGALAEENPDKAKELAAYADESTQAAQGEGEKSVPHSASSMEEFEAQHPELVERVNRLCVILSNMGI